MIYEHHSLSQKQLISNKKCSFWKKYRPAASIICVSSDSMINLQILATFISKTNFTLKTIATEYLNT